MLCEYHLIYHQVKSVASTSRGLLSDMTKKSGFNQNSLGETFEEKRTIQSKNLKLLHEYDVQDETNSNFQDESEKIPSEIFREIYIFFPRSEKKKSVSLRFHEKTDTVVFEKNKKNVRPTFD